MADKIPVKATYSGNNVVGLAEFVTSDTVPVLNGGTGTTTKTGTGSVVLNTSPSLSDASLTGVPTAPTAAVSTSTTQLATTEFAVREALTKAVAMSIALG